MKSRLFCFTLGALGTLAFLFGVVASAVSHKIERLERQGSKLDRRVVKLELGGWRHEADDSNREHRKGMDRD